MEAGPAKSLLDHEMLVSKYQDYLLPGRRDGKQEFGA